MNLEKKYFYITLHFSPKYEETTFENIEKDIYQNILTGELFRKRRMYDFGWGQEDGFELLPPLSFNNLITLVEQQLKVKRKQRFWKKYTDKEKRDIDVHNNNLFGAVSVIMQDYVEELIDFLQQKIHTEYFTNPGIRMNFKLFSFSSQKSTEEGKIPGGVLTQSYEDILNEHPKWKEISSRVIELVYQ